MSIKVQEVFDFFNKQYKNEKGELIVKLSYFKDINEYPEAIQDLLNFINRIKDLETDEFNTSDLKGTLKLILINFIKLFDIKDNIIVTKITKPSFYTIKDLIKLPIEYWFNEELVSILYAYRKLIASRRKVITQLELLLFTLYAEKKEDLPVFNNLDDILNYSLSKDKLVYISDFDFDQLLLKEENKDIEKIEFKEPDDSGSNKWYYKKPNSYVLTEHKDKKHVWLMIPNGFWSK